MFVNNNNNNNNDINNSNSNNNNNNNNNNNDKKNMQFQPTNQNDLFSLSINKGNSSQGCH